MGLCNTPQKPCPGCGVYLPGGYHAGTCPVEYPRTGPFTDHPTPTPSREGRTCKKHEQWCPNGLCRWCETTSITPTPPDQTWNEKWMDVSKYILPQRPNLKDWKDRRAAEDEKFIDEFSEGLEFSGDSEGFGGNDFWGPHE